jgi:intracellular proteinase inhibitor BsuPI
VACEVEEDVRRVHVASQGLRAWLASALVLMGLVSGCQSPRSGQDSGVEARTGTAEVSLLLRASQAVYAPGEPPELTLEVMNHSARAATLRFRTAQRYDLPIQNAQGQEVWRWSAEQMFAQVLGEETLPPNGGKLTYRVVTRESLPPGSYTVIGVVPAVDARL